jgi:hypothetical protein
MSKFLRDFYYEEDAMGVVEIVIIIAVLVAVALIFKDTLIAFASDLMKKVFNTETRDNATEATTTGVYQSGD